MAAEGNVIIFYCCNLFFLNFVSIDERPAMGSQPNLAVKLEVVSIYKCPPEILGPSLTNLGCKKHQCRIEKQKC